MADTKQYGIRVTMPPTDPMRAPHLLGEDWEALRWFDSEEERDAVFEDMNRRVEYYRDGDNPSRILAKIES
ncbi:MAG: hypothetical protein OER43_12400 [Gammaproteobacteria bacterium]|nr:hypothetical protein [Gammaproteobacteria bacterium]MDH3411401.1 hypothetical protein [Gammaproteobacteria bacterium]